MTSTKRKRVNRKPTALFTLAPLGRGQGEGQASEAVAIRSVVQFLKLNVLILVLVFTSHANAGDWPYWRGPNRNGKVESALQLSDKATFERVWTAQIGTGFSSIVGTEERVYSMGNHDDQDIVSCLNAKTGELVWSFQYPAPLDPNLFEGGPTATPTLDGDSVYVLSRRGEVHCLTAESGEVSWKKNVAAELELNIPTWGFSGSPLVVGDRLILNIGSAGVCLNKSDGAVIWKSGNSEDAGYTTPVPVTLGDQQAVLLVSGKSLNAVNLESGEIFWSERWITRYGINAADPQMFGTNDLVLSSGYGKGTARFKVAATSSEQLWRSRELKNQLSPGIVFDQHLYATDGDAGDENALVCLSLETGEQAWSEDGFGAGTMISVAGKLLVLSEKGELSILQVDPTRMQRFASAIVNEGKCWTPGCLIGDCFYCRNAEGNLTCTRLLGK